MLHFYKNDIFLLNVNYLCLLHQGSESNVISILCILSRLDNIFDFDFSFKLHFCLVNGNVVELAG